TESPRLRLRLALRPRDVLRLALPGLQTRLGRRGLDHRIASPTAAARTAAPRRPPARTTRITDSPRTAGPQPRDVLRLARPGLQARLGRRGSSPATSSGSHDHAYRLASDGGAPAPRPPPAPPPTPRACPAGA